MPKNWKYIKKLLEKEFLCEKLRGHITYDFTDYKPEPWYQQHFIMKFDDEILLEAKHPKVSMDSRYNHYDGAWANTYQMKNQVLKKFGIDSCFVNGHSIDRVIEYAIEQANKAYYYDRGIYGVQDIIDCIGIYLHSNIDECFDFCQNPFIRALGLLDRRCGKRRLRKLAKSCCWTTPDWLRRIYVIRFEAEGIKYHEDYKKKKGEQ